MIKQIRKRTVPRSWNRTRLGSQPKHLTAPPPTFTMRTDPPLFSSTPVTEAPFNFTLIQTWMKTRKARRNPS